MARKKTITKKLARKRAWLDICMLIEGQIWRGWTDRVLLENGEFSEEQEDIDKVIVEVKKILEILEKK